MKLLSEIKQYKKGDFKSIAKYLKKYHKLEIKNFYESATDKGRFFFPQYKELSESEYWRRKRTMHKEVYDFIKYGRWQLMFPNAGPITFGHTNLEVPPWGAITIRVISWDEYRAHQQRKLTYTRVIV